ncbi:oligosaccharide flippase family protein [Anaeromyxobacter oryzisoli]|uniref:oligosaccharide flippase family protein n=1 Tax=Anaeromyxobacter oryzisoli TaxID=2925408 RepID=UPI001F584081|nr:oligosaccharide flippase family protein [Anaeromyxobacter sp. SG63]
MLSILSQFAAMQLVLALTGVIRNKVVATRLGPAAFGEIAQIAAVIAVASTLVMFGMGVGLARNVAKHASLEERRAQLASANGLVLCLAAAAVALMLGLLASGRFLPLVGLARRPETVAAAAIFVAAIPVDALKNNYLAVLQGVLDVRGLAMRRSLAVLAATAVAVPVVWLFGFIGAAIQYFALAALVAVLLGGRCRALGYPPLAVRLEPKVLSLLASFGVVSVLSGFAQAFSDAAVRAHVIRVAGPAANGLLQAPYVLSALLQGIVLASIGSVSLAKIAPKTERRDVSASIDAILDVVVPLGTSALGLLGLLGATALSVLYSSQFASGAAFFPWILAADLLLAFVWVIGAPMLARGDRVLWLALNLVYAAARWSVALLLMRRLGPLAVVAGYLAGVALHLALTLGAYRLRYGLHLERRHLRRLALGVVLVGALSVAGASPTRSPLVMAAALGAWLAYSLHHARRGGVLEALRARLAGG